MPAEDARKIGRSNTAVTDRPRVIPWIWEGVVAEGAVTLLSAPEKVGKTTLLSLLLDRRRAGGELLGRTVFPGKTILCSEENDTLWALRQPPLDFGPELLFHRPDDDRPSRGRWKRFIDDLLELSFRDDPFDLLVIDTAVRFLPLGERNKKTLAWSLAQLTLVASFPTAVLILNQSRNVQRPLAAFADIVIEMAIPPGSAATRRRMFSGVGRYPGTLESVSAELNAAGTDYRLSPDGPPPAPPLFATLEALLRASPEPLTRQELLARWLGPAPRPDSLWRALTRGVERGVFIVRGTGTRTDALRYGLAGDGRSTTEADHRT
jgi:hypothetical protein